MGDVEEKECYGCKKNNIYKHPEGTNFPFFSYFTYGTIQTMANLLIQSAI